jgi:drug/metabolite transporter (DMT)-like permease
MATKLWAVGLIFLCTTLTSSAQIFYKFGAAKLPLIFFNWPLLTGLTLYGIGAIIFVIALKGGDVSVLFPIIATSYVWVSLLSNYFFNEPLNIFKWVGIFLIMVGISVIGFGSREKKVKYTEQT